MESRVVRPLRPPGGDTVPSVTVGTWRGPPATETGTRPQGATSTRG